MSILDKRFKNHIKDNLSKSNINKEFEKKLEKYIKEGKLIRDYESIFILDSIPHNMNSEIN